MIFNPHIGYSKLKAKKKKISSHKYVDPRLKDDIQGEICIFTTQEIETETNKIYHIDELKTQI